MKSEVVKVLPMREAEEGPILAFVCFLCGVKEQVSLCNWCRLVFYCGKHHAHHRSRSKCAPFVMVNNGGLRKGRHLLASRDIRPGETILIEKPALVAPACSSLPVCVSCLGKLRDLEQDKCKRCSLPVCSVRCQESDIHTPECTLFAENRVNIKLKANAPNDFYSSIAAIRMMALKSSQEPVKEALWKPISTLPDHTEYREKSSRSEWEMLQMEVVEFLRCRCFLKNQITEEELHNLTGIFMANAVSIGNIKGSSFGKALYSIFSALNHDCLANAKFKVDTNSWAVTVKAQKSIRKGEEITVQYLSSILGTHKRRKRIKGEWYFDCNCVRCGDPTEMETFVSALVCEVCEDDFLLPTEPLDYLSYWSCGSCDFLMNATEAEAKVDAIEDELSLATSKRDLKALEDFVQHYSGKILHPNHYLLLLAKRNYLFISRKNLIDLMTKCTLEEQAELKAAFKSKSDLYKEFWWIPEKLLCSDSF